MQWHGNDRIEPVIFRNDTRYESRQGPRQWPNLFVLEQVHKLPQCTFVRSVGIRRVETGQTQAAQRALARHVQGRAIQEGSAAAGAEELRLDGRRFGKAPAAHRHARNFAQTFTADVAILGEYQV
jgi:hypothetical protein